MYMYILSANFNTCTLCNTAVHSNTYNSIVITVYCILYLEYIDTYSVYCILYYYAYIYIYTCT